MTGREAYDIFQSLRDEFTDEYVSREDFSRFFNTAQKMLLNKELLPFEAKRESGEPPRISIENSQKQLEDWDALVSYDAATPIIAGAITLSNIEATFPDSVKRDQAGIIATEKPKILHVLTLQVSTDGVNYVGAKWRRHNDRVEVNRDPFRMPNLEFPSYYNSVNGWRVYPVTFVQSLATVVREPIFMWFESNGSVNNIDPELKDSTCIRVIKLAVELSAMAHRDQQLAGNIEQIRHVNP